MARKPQTKSVKTGKKRKSRRKKKHTGLKAFITLGLILAVGMGAYVVADHQGVSFDEIRNYIPFLPQSEQEEEVPEVEEAVIPVNPLTGIAEGFDENALNQRPAAFVVENTPDARPQWGMDDPDYAPDIILEGEVEGGITRTLWFYADYNKLPEIIGPMRSARPPYIKFSELFDAYFIHWGQSSSKGDYVGANTIFHKHKVDHINQMTFNDTVGLYGRDQTRSVSAEHRGILYGAKVPDAIKAKEFRTEPEDYTKLSFDPLSWTTVISPAEQIKVDFSSVTSWETTVWTYDQEDKKYHTANFRNDLTRDNLLILYDDTEYINKYDYMNIAGYTVTYCDYKFAGGKGMILSRGVVKDITWRVEDGKLVLIDTELTKIAKERAAAAAEAAAEEDEDSKEKSDAEDSTAVDIDSIEIPASLRQGNTWIGWVSRNNGGNVEIIKNVD